MGREFVPNVADHIPLVVHFLPSCLEIGRTSHDAFRDGNEPVREQIVVWQVLQYLSPDRECCVPDRQNVTCSEDTQPTAEAIERGWLVLRNTKGLEQFVPLERCDMMIRIAPHQREELIAKRLSGCW